MIICVKRHAKIPLFFVFSRIMENNVNAILAELNEEQKKAVQSLD